MKITIKGKGYRQYIKGDYILTPCPNAFNNKVSYWISKRDCSVAVYAFTPLNEKDIEYQLQDDILKSHINLLELTIKDIKERRRIR